MTPTPIEEASFMNQLLQGLDDDFFSAVPSPDSSPLKTKRLQTNPTLPATPTKNPAPSQQPPILPFSRLSASVYDPATFLLGSENWDLDDFSISPVKPSSAKPKVCFHLKLFISPNQFCHSFFPRTHPKRYHQFHSNKRNLK